MKKFEEFGIKPETVESLKEVGIEYPFEIQELSLSIALEGRDIIGQAKKLVLERLTLFQFHCWTK
ncbi:MAG: DEAD/DEAH box helicase [Candidatus Ancillula trichonymphae]|nr:DEAD/DEAH box helicase [Candidatus Ancillula trichonymphae]